ncbi:glycosyltransferase family protein [Niveispirillum sp. KHB5.9]|uniref:glycosyltransferase family protein n=1 Tax=Niveispirillum sp. KHB5.9 TaxID=3400269 RepID=UPI003A877741
MRLSLFNPQAPDHPVAERELALRLLTAVERLGWQAAIQTRSAEVEAFDPDGVINLYPEAAPKLTAHPWLGCAWNPVGLTARLTPPARAGAARHLPAQDAYLVSGPQLEAHMAALRPDAPRLPFHPSSPRSDLAPATGPDSRLFYVGSNWDGQRYPALLRQLAQAGVLALHGTAERWSHLAEAWRGPLPFDGRSVIRAAHRWGMGLCLHLPQHRAEGVPNMRVFELAAAGAVIIADRHPFIEHWFGDRVLYVETEGGEEAAAADILDKVAWVRAHPAAARAMAAGAQAIFNRHLCLEVLLSPLPDLLADLKAGRAAPPRMRLGVLRPEAGEIVMPDGAPPRPLPGAAGLAGLRAAVAGLDGLAILPAGVDWPAGHGDRMARALADSAGGAVLAPGLWPRPAEESGFPLDPDEDRALAPRPGEPVPVAAGAALARLRAGGLCLRTGRLAGLDGDWSDWPSLALDLGPLLAGSAGGVEMLCLPGPRLAGREEGAGAALSRAVRAWPALETFPAGTGEGGTIPLTGIADMVPDLARTIPFLLRAGDFTALPGTGPVWIYGTGRGGELVLEALGPAARGRLAGFLDSGRQGVAHGLPLMRPGDVEPAVMAAATILIAAQYVSDMLRTLRNLPAAPAHIVNAYPFIAARIETLAEAGTGG